jgi:hypothetical protein
MRKYKIFCGGIMIESFQDVTILVLWKISLKYKMFYVDHDRKFLGVISHVSVPSPSCTCNCKNSYFNSKEYYEIIEGKTTCHRHRMTPKKWQNTKYSMVVSCKKVFWV